MAPVLASVYFPLCTMVFLLFSCPQLRHLEIEDALGDSCALDPKGPLGVLAVALVLCLVLLL